MGEVEWAFGVVLYEIITGKRLATARIPRKLRHRWVKDKPDLSDVPANVGRLLERCLEKSKSGCGTSGIWICCWQRVAASSRIGRRRGLSLNEEYYEQRTN